MTNKNRGDAVPTGDRGVYAHTRLSTRYWGNLLCLTACLSVDLAAARAMMGVGFSVFLASIVISGRRA
jgi:hypothetical protein